MWSKWAAVIITLVSILALVCFIDFCSWAAVSLGIGIGTWDRDLASFEFWSLYRLHFLIVEQTSAKTESLYSQRTSISKYIHAPDNHIMTFSQAHKRKHIVNSPEQILCWHAVTSSHIKARSPEQCTRAQIAHLTSTYRNARIPYRLWSALMAHLCKHTNNLSNGTMVKFT